MTGAHPSPIANPDHRPPAEFRVSSFWRLMPAGMRRRWWLFRPFDLLARPWPVGGRRGLLAVRMDGIGDMVLFRGALDHYTEVFGVERSDITVLGCESWQGIASQIFDGYRVLSINEHAYARRPFYRFRVNLRVRRLAPAIVVTDQYFRRALMADSLAWITGAPRQIVSMPYVNAPTRTEFTYYMSQVTAVVDTGPYPTHELTRHARFLTAVAGAEIAAQPPRLTWKRTRDPLPDDRPYAVLNPGSNEYGRRWPLRHYIDLSVRLADKGLRVVFIGKGDERAAGSTIDDAADGDTVLDWTGKTTLPDVLDLMKGAALVVSNDTGPAHIAIGLGAPTVVIVGGGHFGCFVPYPPELTPETVRFVYERMDCYHCFWRCPKREDRKQSFPCVAAVAIESVESACDAVLKAAAD